MSQPTLATSPHAAAALPFWHKAVQRLAEVGSMDLAAAPASAVHSAYYAMYNATRAVAILARGPEVTARHDGLISLYGRLAEEAQDQAMCACGRDFNRVKDARNKADYVGGFSPDLADAQSAVARARRFLAFAAGKYGFSLPPDSAEGR